MKWSDLNYTAHPNAFLATYFVPLLVWCPFIADTSLTLTKVIK